MKFSYIAASLGLVHSVLSTPTSHSSLKTADDNKKLPIAAIQLWSLNAWYRAVEDIFGGTTGQEPIIYCPTVIKSMQDHVVIMEYDHHVAKKEHKYRGQDEEETLEAVMAYVNNGKELFNNLEDRTNDFRELRMENNLVKALQKLRRTADTYLSTVINLISNNDDSRRVEEDKKEYMEALENVIRKAKEGSDESYNRRTSGKHYSKGSVSFEIQD